MGTHKFQMEYIEYLQNRNTDLLNKISELKENYENKIIAKDMNRQYLLSLMKDVVNVCSSIPQQIDVFFEEMSAAMETLRNILLKKSEMVQLTEKISQAIQLVSLKQEVDNNSELNSSKKSGTVKVSPMINGHVILTEPRIYLNRVSKTMFPLYRKESQQLSPILEMSPLTPGSSVKEKQHNKGPVIYIEDFDKQSDESNNFNFKRFSSPRGSRRHSVKKSERKSFSKSPVNQGEQKIKRGQPNDNDPLEGPSWLLNNSKFSNGFVNFRRRRRRFAEKFDKLCKNDYSVEEESSFDETIKSYFKKDKFLSEEISIVDKKKLSSRASSSRASKKELEENRKVSSSKNSPEIIEETPKRISNARTKTKEEMLKEISKKQPLVALEDCMTNEALKKMISPRSTKSNDVKVIDLEDKKILSHDSSCPPENKDAGENKCESEKNLKILESRSDFVTNEENDKNENQNILDKEKNAKDLTEKSWNVLPFSSDNFTENKTAKHEIDSVEPSNTPVIAKINCILDNENEDLSNTYIVDPPTITGSDFPVLTSSNALEDKEPVFLVLCDDENTTNKTDGKSICSENNSSNKPEDVDVVEIKNENESLSDRFAPNANLREPRKKRRAAPTNLCEPRLGTKLRRD